jgi:hypothetical protein
LRQAHAAEIWMTGCHLPSLEAVQLEVRGNLILDGLTAASVDLRSACVTGMLSLDSAVSHNPGGTTRCAAAITAGRHMSCGSGVTSAGMVKLAGAEISHGLSVTGADLTNASAEQWALDAQGTKVSYVLFLAAPSIGDPGGFTASGGLRLVGARIGGFVCCWGADISGLKISEETSFAIAGRGLTVSENLMVNRGFTADGEIDLASGLRVSMS